MRLTGLSGYLGSAAIAAAFISTPALALDFSSTSNVDWSGFYAGIFAEGDAMNAHAGPGSLSGGGPGYDFSGNGGMVGGTAGINIQEGQLLYGGEVSLAIGDITATNDPLTVPSITVNTVAMLRGRAGVVLDRMVFFGTAALGVAGANSFETHATTAGSSGVHVGAAFGAGADIAITDTMFVRVEGEHAMFQPVTYSFPEDSEHTHEVGFSTNALRVGAFWQF